MLTCKMSYCVQSVRQNISCPRCYFYHIKCKRCYFYNIKWCTFSTWRALGCDKYFAARDFKLSEKLPHLTLTFEKNAKVFLLWDIFMFQNVILVESASVWVLSLFNRTSNQSIHGRLHSHFLAFRGLHLAFSFRIFRVFPEKFFSNLWKLDKMLWKMLLSHISNF